MAEYGLTAEGFRRKRLPEIIESLNDRVSDKLGVQIQTGANSLFGQIHGVYGYEIADLWELAENVYNAMYPPTAQGVSLTNAAALAGIPLIEAEHTTIVATCYGTEGASVPRGAQIVSSSDVNMTFTCVDSDRTISAARASYASLTIAAIAAGTAYSLTIDGTTQSYTAAASDTVNTALVALADLFSFDDKTLTVTNDSLIVTMNDERETFSFAASNFTVQSIGSPFNFRADELGAVSPVVGEVTQIVTPYSGWTGVSNNVAAAVGREAETDTALRQRWSASVYSRGSAMVEAIQSAIYENVDGVTACIVYENTSDTTDADGRYPHSVEAVVEGGDDEKIAQELWSHKAAGIDTYGDEAVTIYDSQGVSHVMRFNRPTKVKVWLRLTVTHSDDTTVEALGSGKVIADAVLAACDGYSVGADVILQKFIGVVFGATNGVGYVEVQGATGETPGAYTSGNITISPREVAIFDASRITVGLE